MFFILLTTMNRIWEWLRKQVTWKGLVAAILLVLPVVLYVMQFRKHKISDNPEDWGVFGDYIGGVYTVLVTFFAIYLTRSLQKRDAEKNKARAAVSVIYEQIGKIDYQHVDMRSVNKLLRLTKENELYVPQYLFDKLTDLYDDYVVAKDNPHKFNKQNELSVKKQLKQLYES